MYSRLLCGFRFTAANKLWTDAERDFMSFLKNVSRNILHSVSKVTSGWLPRIISVKNNHNVLCDIYMVGKLRKFPSR